jgi:hypothetical protein
MIKGTFYSSDPPGEVQGQNLPRVLITLRSGNLLWIKIECGGFRSVENKG